MVLSKKWKVQGTQFPGRGVGTASPPSPHPARPQAQKETRNVRAERADELTRPHGAASKKRTQDNRSRALNHPRTNRR